ncbi:ABC transporter permease [Dongia sedimenti]|uniref:ABC transporter permease n=1 Tax=Dongia sedimenti TaxID=3064282 RepID=A0ABU0YNA0_9PROT|nr:ABC transporter permease [Rhodospirillaceae bacterium R-7]
MGAMANRRGFIVTLLMLAPSTVLIAVFLIAPMLIVLGYSFAGRDAYGGIVPGFNLDSYRELFQPLYFPIFWNSVKLAFWNTVLCVLTAYPIAYFIAFRAGRFAPVLLILMLIPFWIDFLIRISAWVVLMGRNGMINSVLTATILDEPARMLGTYGAVLVGLVYAFLPSAVFPIYAALQPIDRALLEAGRDLGAGPVQNFRRVTLPLSMPGVMAACLFVFVPSMGVFAIPVLLGGGKSIIIGNLIVQLFLDFRNMPLGSAVSVVLLVFSSLGILLYMRALRRVEAARA